MHYAKTLLLVHDEQSEIAEGDVLRQQPVSADHDVDLACLEAFERLFLFGLRPESADHVNPDRERREALAQRLRVLKGEHGRGREERDLLAFHHHLEGGTHGDLGLAVPDVSAEQAVHGRR